MSKTLFLAWQDTPTREWFPVGRLDARVTSRAPLYRFRYVQGAVDAHDRLGFQPLYDFPDFHKSYSSSVLFPLFQNRVIGKERKDFRQYLEFLDLAASQGDPMEMLAIDGGYRATDNFEVFPKIEQRKDGRFSCRFFLHGCHHTNATAKNRLESLTAGEKLYISVELTNPATGLAVQIMTEDYHMIGWAPRYLVSDLVRAIAKGLDYSARVVRINPQPAPSKQRVLVEMQGRWPDIEPMETEDFTPLS